MGTASGEPGIFVELEIAPEAVRVLYAERIAHVSRTELRAPLLTATASPGLAGSSELVVATLNAGGTREQFGWSTRTLAFMDREDEKESGAPRGTPFETQLNGRVLRIPVPEDVQFLLFYASEFPAVSNALAPGELPQRPLALYFTGGPEADIPPVPPHPILSILPLVPWRLPFRPAGEMKQPYRPLRVADDLLGSTTLMSTGTPADRFDIVILGDGFTLSELAEFDRRAEAIANGLIAMPPFSALASKINIHTVRAVSLESGITDCPASGASKSTYFGVRGNFNGLYPGFVGTVTPERVYEAAELIAPRGQLEVYLVIANCPMEGGSAFPAQRLAFVTMYADTTRFVNFAAHELAHVIAGTCEEYIGCAEQDPMQAYPNQATDAQRIADTISWKPLARPGELDSLGRFRAQHVFGDRFDQNHQPVVAPELTGMLGAYWGSQNIATGMDPTPCGCHPYDDPRGAGFFRPMAECRMRKSFFDFCRVCSAQLTEVITAYAP